MQKSLWLVQVALQLSKSLKCYYQNQLRLTFWYKCSPGQTGYKEAKPSVRASSHISQSSFWALVSLSAQESYLSPLSCDKVLLDTPSPVHGFLLSLIYLCQYHLVFQLLGERVQSLLTVWSQTVNTKPNLLLRYFLFQINWKISLSKSDFK